MEESENLDISAPIFTSSWPIRRGSLDRTITCESSISAVDSDLTNRKSPLILHRTLPDSGPCEITILFKQLHEIKQIYVRSTSRLYEVYYAVDESGDNEYLCTVRCGVAARIKETVEETDGAVSLSLSFSSSNRSSCEGSTNEDGWVDVKMQNSSVHGAKDSCLTKKDDSCLEQSIQDWFEATAEISDADPVLSVTIRLLSIQSGDHLIIDEIYVFADPVVSDDTNSSTNTRETSSESATMSLLIPTLLQMSKLRRNQNQEQRDSHVGAGRHQGVPHESFSAASISNTSQSECNQDTKLNGASVPLCQPEFPVQTLDSQNNSYFTSEKDMHSRVERTLEELVSRVAKIEQFCLRFEENMLKPISNIEVRLERVEQQLESLSKTATLSMTACTKFSAPEFSSIDSESNSIFTDGNDGTMKSELVKQGDDCLQDNPVTHLNAYSSSVIQPNDMFSSSTDVPHLHPSLVITAPDFLSVDVEENNDTVEAVKDSPIDSLKKPISIDDALASALSGFLLSASTIDIDSDVKNADISCEEESGYTSCLKLHQQDDGGNISIEDVILKEDSFGTDNGVVEVAECVDEQSLIYEELDTENDANDLIIEIRSENVDEDPNYKCIFGCTDFLANDTSVSASAVPAGNSEFSTGEENAEESDNIEFSTGKESAEESDSIEFCSGKVTGEESCRELTNILEFQRPLVDFAIPILDVNFSSTENLTVKSSLDTLLLDVPKLSTEECCVEEDNATPSGELSDLVALENAVSKTFLTSNDILFHLDNYDSSGMLLDSEEKQQECSIKDMGGSLI